MLPRGSSEHAVGDKVALSNGGVLGKRTAAALLRENSGKVTEGDGRWEGLGGCRTGFGLALDREVPRAPLA